MNDDLKKHPHPTFVLFFLIISVIFLHSFVSMAVNFKSNIKKFNFNHEIESSFTNMSTNVYIKDSETFSTPLYVDKNYTKVFEAISEISNIDWIVYINDVEISFKYNEHDFFELNEPKIKPSNNKLKNSEIVNAINDMNFKIEENLKQESISNINNDFNYLSDLTEFRGNFILNKDGMFMVSIKKDLDLQNLSYKFKYKDDLVYKTELSDLEKISAKQIYELQLAKLNKDKKETRRTNTIYLPIIIR